MKAFLAGLLTALIVFGLCSLVIASSKHDSSSNAPTEETIEAMKNRSEGSAWLGEPFLSDVGDTLDLNFVKHIEDDEYEIAYTNKDGELIWVNTNVDMNGDIKVVYDKNINSSFIERNENKVKVKKHKVKFKGTVHTVHIANGTLESGKIERSCGKNCTDEIETEIIGE